MSFDGLLLSKIVEELKIEISSGRVSKIYQLSNHDLLLQIRSNSKKHELIISSSPEYSRIHLTTLPYNKPNTPPMFCMFLRKHLEGSVILDILQYSLDRVIIFKLATRNELGDKSNKFLIAEIMGKHSNIIVTDESYKILEAIKHVSPFDQATRTIHPGAIYQFPESNKINIRDEEKVNNFFKERKLISSSDIQENFIGFSPLLAKEIEYVSINNKISMQEAFNHVINRPLNPILYNDKRQRFYIFKLNHVNTDSKTFESVNSLVDAYYYNKDELRKVKQKSKDLESFLKNNLSKINKKLIKLEKQILDADDRDDLRVKGELIKANLHVIKKGEKSLKCLNYYTNLDTIVSLDPKLSPVKNSEKYFKKFKKLKASIPYLQEEIKISNRLKEYFELLQVQLENSSLNDIEEIRNELIDKKLLKTSKKNSKQKYKKNKKPNFETFLDSEGIEIVVGKNNLQNDYITHKLAKRLEVWFHVKDAPGSHVLVRKEFPLSETTIRTASMLAAHYSKLRNSSSVGVDYLEVKHLKKVSGKMNSFVTYSTNKTIYIDPDEDFILNLKRK